ncbi:Cytochrome P450 [Gossypium australe]|uniref:Cytochrome P450 n=1 Tax=Gossypium australe TaxID=47621 RepID=A0A5B6VHM1_9ROSI|nr:Cytochrome P450 [Gossypium australe]
MGPDLNLTEKATSIVVSTDKESSARNKENKGMQGNIGLEVDLIECMDSVESEMVDVECQDATEFSSSFSDTISGDEDGSIVNDGVESPLPPLRLFGSLTDGWNGQFQMGKRRLTDHWRRFIHPIEWRCKWLEIKLCELKSQALKYERELAEYDKSKQFEFGKVTSEGFDAKSRAFPSKAQRKEVMKRRKRKRVEDTTDVATYMSHHNIFSYHGMELVIILYTFLWCQLESKKSIDAAAAFALVDDWGDLGDNRTIHLVISTDNKTTDGYDENGWPYQSRDGDDLMEQILWKTERLQSRVRILKTRMDKVVSESPQKFSSVNMLSSVVQSDALNNSECHHYAEKDDRNSLQCTTSRHASECLMWDDFIPESSLSGQAELATLPDMIRNMSQCLLAFSSENIEADILIPNQAAEEELRSFGSCITQQAEKPHVLIDNSKSKTVPGDNLQINNTSLQPNVQPPFLNSKQADNRRAGGVKKSDLSGWSRRSSG